MKLQPVFHAYDSLIEDSRWKLIEIPFNFLQWYLEGECKIAPNWTISKEASTMFNQIAQGSWIDTSLAPWKLHQYYISLNVLHIYTKPPFHATQSWPQWYYFVETVFPKTTSDTVCLLSVVEMCVRRHDFSASWVIYNNVETCD